MLWLRDDKQEEDRAAWDYLREVEGDKCAELMSTKYSIKQVCLKLEY